MAAGKPNPIVPSPPEVSHWRGRENGIRLRRPHLVLPDVGRHDRVGWHQRRACDG